MVSRRSLVLTGLVLLALTSVTLAGYSLSDDDGDGLRNYREWVGPTISDNPDTDEDGLEDGRERVLGTDPLEKDTDRDGLPDGPEVERYQSDPGVTDTSGDGIRDSVAARYGLNPTHAYPDGFAAVLSALDAQNATAAQNLVSAVIAEGEISEDGWALRDAVAGMRLNQSIPIIRQAVRDQRIDERDLEASRILSAAPRNFTEVVTSAYPNDKGWDDDGDGLLTAAETHVYGTNGTIADPELGSIHAALAGGTALTSHDVRTLQLVADYLHARDTYKDAVVGEWQQIQELELLPKISADGNVSEDEYELLKSDDQDILLNPYERRVTGTNLSAADTDEDKIRDDYELFLEGTLPGASPLVKDMYFEVDRMEGVSWIAREAKKQIKEDFGSSPVDNGSGIHVHFLQSETVPANTINITEDPPGKLNHWMEYWQRFSDNKGSGIRYLLLASKMNFPRPAGIVSFPIQEKFVTVTGIAIEDGSTDWRGPTIEHEIGHLAGLSNDAFHGIDSREIPYSKYPSVMNYNRPRGTYGFSDGSNSNQDFNDWELVGKGNFYSLYTGEITLRQEGATQVR